MGFCSRAGSKVLCPLPLLWLRRNNELCVGKSPVVWRLAIGTTGVVSAVRLGINRGSLGLPPDRFSCRSTSLDR